MGKAISATVSGKKTTSRRHPYRKMTENNQQQTSFEKKSSEISEIINHIRSNKHTVFGNWSCHKCENEWEGLYTQKSLKMHVEETPEKLGDLFSQNCDECNRKRPILGFLLYPRPLQEDLEPIEIKRRHVWNNHYRVFGSWKCQHCQNRWKSAHTWISLQKYINETPGEQLNRNDYYMQKCKKCEKGNNNIILSYVPLDSDQGPSEENGPGPHKKELCAKCESGALCVFT